MISLVLLRHGESLWNRENRFTGWTDVDLSERGVEEAREAGRLMRCEGLDFDIAWTSVLKRAIRTLWWALDEMDRMWLPVQRHWRLNERHYGALQGLNKAETAAKYGDEQVLAWRRGFSTLPPPLEASDSRHPRFDRRYGGIPPHELPASESLESTIARFLPLWHREIAPQIRTHQRLLIVAHGNSLRALVKYLDGISDEEIVGLNIPTGIPLVYELDEDLHPRGRRYLGDPETARKAAEAVARQGLSVPPKP